MGHGLAYLPGSGWAVLAILTYYVYAPVAARFCVHGPGLLAISTPGSARNPHVYLYAPVTARCPVPNCLRRRRP